MMIRLTKMDRGYVRLGFISAKFYKACNVDGEALTEIPPDGRVWLRCPNPRDGWIPLECDQYAVVSDAV